LHIIQLAVRAVGIGGYLVAMVVGVVVAIGVALMSGELQG
jgi:hypothetical protein